MTGKKTTLIKILMLAAYLLIILSNLCILVLSLSKPQYSLPGWQMTIGSILCAVIITVCFFLWNQFLSQKGKPLHIAYLAMLLVFGVLLFYICCTCRNALSSQGDYEVMWQMALDINKGRDLGEYDYLNYYSNNFKPMLFLSVLFKISSLLHLTNPYYLVVFVSVVEVLGTIPAVSYLAARKGGASSYQIPVLLSFALFLPLWANTQAFYTDAMSFGLIVIALALAKRGQCASSYRKYLLLTISGLIAAIGISVKITLLIPLIALFLALLLTKRLKASLSSMLCFAASLLTGYLLIEYWACTYSAYLASKEVSDPIISWIAIGLLGNGSYADNVDFVWNVHSFASKAEKTTYIKEIISENKSNFYSFAHITDKIRTTYADGSFGAGVFSMHYDTKPNLIWNAFSPYGKYFWRTSQLCFCYIFGIYIILLIGQIRTFFHMLHNKMPSLMLFFSDLTLLGVFLFMGLWEANNRQLYNQIPIVLLGLVLHLSYFFKAKKR